jgi:Hemerythrin HHE cation binding domain
MTDTKESETIAAAAVAGHGLTPAQYEECMRINDRWPQPGDRDGWVLEHNAIRLDMRDLANAIATCIGQGGNLTPWQVDILQSNWLRFNTQIHMHHDIEEKLFFPFMNTKVTLPPKMSADHTVREQNRAFLSISQYLNDTYIIVDD